MWAYSIFAAALAASTATVQLAAQPPSPDSLNASGRAMLAKFVGFRTVAGRGQVPEMARYIAGELKKAGFEQQDIEVRQTGETASLAARLRGPASSAKSPILFLGHMDVVDADPKEWKYDPWKVTEVDGGLFGRGVVDNKFGLVALTQAFIRLRREGYVPDRDVVLALSGDEEIGGDLTARPLAEQLKGAAFAINSDAGGGFRSDDGKASYFIQASEKSYATFEVTAKNKGGHSSAPRSDNAIYDLAVALQKIATLKFPIRWNDVTLEGFAGLVPVLSGELRPAVAQFVKVPGDAAAVRVMERDPDINREIRTTCVATMLKAGQVENALPVSATATVNCRIFPGEAIQQVRRDLEKAIANKTITVSLLGKPVEGMVSEVPAEARAALQRVLAVRLPRAELSRYMEAGSTDGGHYRKVGIPTVGMGPLISSSDTSYNFHGNDERLPVKQFDDGLSHYYLFIKALTGPTK